jgi:hypothetical protein
VLKLRQIRFWNEVILMPYVVHLLPFRIELIVSVNSHLRAITHSTTTLGGPTQASTGAPSSTPAKAPSLIDRLNLLDQISLSSSSSLDATTSGAAGGKAAWEDSAAKREASLREQEAQVVLAAQQ